MNLNDYQILANRTLRDDVPDEMLLHAAMGMATEAGEFIDSLKKHRFYGKRLDRQNLIEEIGDVAWYLAAACKALDVTLEEVCQANVAKLRARYPAGFTEHDAIHRDVVSEAVAMAGGTGG